MSARHPKAAGAKRSSARHPKAAGAKRPSARATRSSASLAKTSRAQTARPPRSSTRRQQPPLPRDSGSATARTARAGPGSAANEAGTGRTGCLGVNGPGPPGARRGLDRVAVVRGASRGFSVLVLGEMLLRVAGPSQQQFGLLFALLGAAGFTTAGIRAARASVDRAVIAGSAAAVVAFVLTLPLRMMLHDPVMSASTGISVGYAAVVGAVAGLLARRQRPSSPVG